MKIQYKHTHQCLLCDKEIDLSIHMDYDFYTLHSQCDTCKAKYELRDRDDEYQLDNFTVLDYKFYKQGDNDWHSYKNISVGNVTDRREYNSLQEAVDYAKRLSGLKAFI